MLFKTLTAAALLATYATAQSLQDVLENFEMINSEVQNLITYTLTFNKSREYNELEWGYSVDGVEIFLGDFITDFNRFNYTAFNASETLLIYAAAKTLLTSTNDVSAALIEQKETILNGDSGNREIVFVSFSNVATEAATVSADLIKRIPAQFHGPAAVFAAESDPPIDAIIAAYST